MPCQHLGFDILQPDVIEDFVVELNRIDHNSQVDLVHWLHKLGYHSRAACSIHGLNSPGSFRKSTTGPSPRLGWGQQVFDRWRHRLSTAGTDLWTGRWTHCNSLDSRRAGSDTLEGAGCCTSEQHLLDSRDIAHRCSAVRIAIVAIGNNLDTYGLDCLNSEFIWLDLWTLFLLSFKDMIATLTPYWW